MASPPPASVTIEMPSQTNGEPASSPKVAADESQTNMPAAAAPSSPDTTTDKVMSSMANLAQLLPTGTVMAYQALSPSFTNHGTCYPANRWLTAVLVGVLAALSVFFSFTDSIIGRDRKLYYGVATAHGFRVFNDFSREKEEDGQRELEAVLGVHDRQRLRLRPVDYVHAVFTAVVFLTLAFSDVGLQRCFFSGATDNTNEILKNLPLGMAVLSSFVFLIFPTKRKGIGYNDPGQNNAASFTPRQNTAAV